MDNEVDARMGDLMALFNAIGIPSDEVTYKALVEVAEWLRQVRDYAVHYPEFPPAA